MKRSMLSAAVLVALCCAPAHAQTAAQQEARKLDTVFVIGTAPVVLPANTGEVDARAAARQSTTTSDTAQLLSNIAGVNVQQAGGVSSLPVIHGQAGDRNRVLVDGQDVIASCPNHMNPPLSYIAPASVGEVKVYAGIAPVSAGGDSIGGTVSVQSKPPRFAAEGAGWELAGEAGAYFRSNGRARGANLSMMLANDRFSIEYRGNVARAENYVAGGDFRGFTATGRQGHDLPRDEVASTAYSVRNHALRAAYRAGDHLFHASASVQDMPLQLYPNQRMDLLDNQRRNVQIGYQTEQDWGTFEARAWKERVSHAMGFGPDKQYWYGMQTMVPGTGDYSVPCAPLGPTCAADMPMLTRSETQAFSATLGLKLRSHDMLRIGTEWQHYQLDDFWPPSGGMMWPEVFWNVHEGRRNRSALFAEWEGELAPRWMGLFGLRYTRIHSNAGQARGYDVDPAPPGSYMMTAMDAAAFNARDRARNDTHLDAVALLRYSPADTLDVELGYARKNRSPNLYERYAWSTWTMAAVMNNTTGDGNGYVGRIDLKPERAQTVSATVDWHAAGHAPAWRVRITPWMTRVADYIDAVPLTANGPAAFNVLRYTNQSARLHGVDVSAEARIARTEAGDFGIRAIAGWQRGENRDTGQPLYQQMPANAKFSLTHAGHGWDNAIEWVLVDAKDRVGGVRNEIRTAGYGLLNLRAGYEWKAWRFDAGVENVFDKGYALPTGGTYTAQGRTMGINSIPWGIAVPGAGRSYSVGVKLAF